MFYSSLTGKIISDEEYEHILNFGVDWVDLKHKQ